MWGHDLKAVVLGVGVPSKGSCFLESKRKPRGKPKEKREQTKEKPKENPRESARKPKGNQRKSIIKPKGNHASASATEL